jgi:putative hydrolase of the HAD superfamily
LIALTSEAPKAVLLDLDDTILDDSGQRERCWRRACSEFASGSDVERLLVEINRVREFFWNDEDRHRRWRMDMPAAQREIGKQAAVAAGLSEAAGESVGSLYFKLREELRRPFDGAVETLVELRTRHLRLGLITNGAAVVQRAKLDRFDLLQFFEYVGIEGERGVGKPDRGAFETALTQLRCTATETWMVGDSLDWDVLPAHELGMVTVWVDRTGVGVPAASRARPSRVIGTLRDLLEILPVSSTAPTAA